MSVGIVGYGAYIPRYRIKREVIGKAWGGGGRGENSIPNYDEDVITMAEEACENAISQAGLNIHDIGGIYFGSASKPYIEQSSIGIIAQAIGARDDIEMIDFGISTRASGAALKSCADALLANRIGYGLVVNSDWRQAAPGSAQEMNFGAGASAFILGKDKLIAEIEGIACYNTYFMDTWRGVSDSYVGLAEPRYTREWGYGKHVEEAARRLMSNLNLSASNFQHIVFQYPSDMRMLRAVARNLGFNPEQMEKAAPAQEIGDCGNASAPLGIISVLDQANPGDRILGIFYGSGMTDAISVVVKEEIDKVRRNGRTLRHYLDSKEYIDDYTEFLKTKGEIKDPEAPALMYTYPDSPFWSRDSEELHRLIGNKCNKCGYINYPPSQKKICIRCGSTELELTPLSRKGKVHTYNYDVYAPPPLVCPVVTLVLTLEDGMTFKVLGTEMKPEDIKFGMPVELVLRRICVEKGISNYAWTFGRQPR